jgi:hypothetical protein
MLPKDGFKVLLVLCSRNEARDCYTSPDFRLCNNDQNCQNKFQLFGMLYDIMLTQLKGSFNLRCLSRDL